jgi:hypothetical protein
MESVAAVSGGRVYYPRSPADVAAPFGEIASSLGGAYSLGYDPPSDGDAGAPRRIEVLVRPAGLVVTQSRDSYRVGPR